MCGILRVVFVILFLIPLLKCMDLIDVLEQFLLSQQQRQLEIDMMKKMIIALQKEHEYLRQAHGRIHFTIKELAEQVIEKIDPKLKVVYHPLPEDDPLQRKPDIGKAKEILGWEPKVKLSEGLDATIAHFASVI